MEPNRPIFKARRAARCGASGKRHNTGDRSIWPTEGRFFEPSELRLSSLMVGAGHGAKRDLFSRPEKAVKWFLLNTKCS